MDDEIKNFADIEYKILFSAPPKKYNADGLCDNPEVFEFPVILINPKLKTRRKLNVLIEEIFHAYFFDLPEYKARRFSAALGRVIYKHFLSNPGKKREN